MAVHHSTDRSSSVGLSPRRSAEATEPGAGSPVVSPATARWLAVSRLALAFIFLWAFLDKLFGLGYSTPGSRSWIAGGSPTAGFLGRVEVGPFAGFFQALAGVPVVDWLFMLGLLGIGLALALGIGMRVAAVGATVMMLMMWAAEWPPATATLAGEPSGSTNPLVEYHIIYALLAVVLALTEAGRVWGFGRTWQSTPLVRRASWLR